MTFVMIYLYLPKFIIHEMRIYTVFQYSLYISIEERKLFFKQRKKLEKLQYYLEIFRRDLFYFFCIVLKCEARGRRKKERKNGRIIKFMKNTTDYSSSSHKIMKKRVVAKNETGKKRKRKKAKNYYRK